MKRCCSTNTDREGFALIAQETRRIADDPPSQRQHDILPFKPVLHQLI